MNNSTDTSSPAPIAPRRTSIPNILLARHHREPLAVLDPQSANSRVADDSNRATSSMFAYSQQQSDQKDNDHNRGLSSYPIGRQIMDQYAVSDEDIHKQAAPSSSKFSAAQISSTELQSKRENNSSSRQIPSSVQNARRASVPAIHFKTSSSFGIDQSIPPLPENPAYISSDELYSDLGSFTFGTVQSTRTSTPAPEIFDASLGRLMDQKPRRSLSSIPTARDEILFDEADAARSNRAKMRAIDDGSRRPSLPKNPTSDLPPQHHTRKRSSVDTNMDRNVSLEADRSSTYTFGFPGIYNNFIGDPNHKDNEDIFDVVSSSPVVFAQSRPLSPDYDVDEDVRFSISLFNDERRGSLPVDIPAHSTSSDEDSIKTRRKMSRSLDNDIRTINSGIEGMMGVVTGANSQSEPLTRGEWSSIEHQHQRTQTSDTVPEENPYEGLNLAYIFGENPLSGVPRKSWSSGGSIVQRQPEPSSSAAQNHFGLWFNTGASDSRRPSSATINEDTFYRHLRNNDANYDARLSEWSFGKEKADGAGPHAVSVHSGVSKGSTSNTVYIHEIWRCQQVGRFDVQIGTLLRYSESDSAKPPQYRLVGKHMIDPFLKNTRGGPHFMVHKHTRATAFSIFRSHALFATPGRVDTSNSILLATKSVQEVYTSTKTTNKLKTHGLLEETWNEDRSRERSSRRSQSGSRASPRAASSSRKDIEKREKEKEKEKKKAKEKEKGRDKHRDGGLSQTASRDSAQLNAQSQSTRNDSFVSNWTRHLSGRHASPPLNQPPPVPSQTNNAQVSSASNASQAQSVANIGAWNVSRSALDVPSRNHHPPLHQSSSRLGLRDRFAVDEDDDTDIVDEYHLPVQRRTHAETYDSLTPLHHEHARQSLKSSASSSSSSRLRKIFPTRKGMNLSDWPSNSPSAAMVPSPVPWMLTNNSEKTEEGQIVMSNLNDNFGAVGLVPPRQPNRTPNRQRSSRMDQDVLHRVPDSSLYMLLPLFAGDFEPAYRPKEWDPTYEVRLEDRKYLLVYYVPFDKRGNKGVVVPDTTIGQGKHKSKSVHLPSFRVSAHIMSYNDFRGSGVKLPSTGLSVMGPLSKATPPTIVPDVHTDAVAIAQCSKKENGIEFLPEGLHKLGLCHAEAIPQAFNGGSDGGMEDEVELKFELTAIGRAVVELAWAGAMAVSCLDA